MENEADVEIRIPVRFGRIGRNFLRCWHGRENSPIEVVVINDSGGVKQVSKAAVQIHSKRCSRQQVSCSHCRSWRAVYAELLCREIYAPWFLGF
jgi:hypothetical protein